MGENKRNIKVALVNMGYRPIGRSEEGAPMYGKPIINVLIGAYIEETSIVLQTLVNTYKEGFAVYSKECIPFDVETSVENLITLIMLAEYDLRIEKASECGHYENPFNFVTKYDTCFINENPNDIL